MLTMWTMRRLVMFMLVMLVMPGDTCVWEEVTTSWNAGRKVMLSLPVNELLNEWNVQFTFSSPVQLEAWRGDVYKLSDTEYNVTNKCYNGRLYPCQCLELGYLLRYQSGSDPTANISFNSVALAACASEPDCSGEESQSTQEVSTDSTTITTTQAEQTTIFSSLELHPCLSLTSPCHPDASCLPTGDTTFDCECPVGTVGTGEDLYNPLSVVTACTQDSSTNLTSQLNTVDASEKYLTDLFQQDLAFTLLLNTFLTDNSSASVEDFLVSMISSPVTLDLLTAGVGSDSLAVQAVLDVLGGDTSSIETFLNALSSAGFTTPELRRLYREKRAVSTSALKIYIKYFYSFVRLLKHYMEAGDVCELLEQVKEVLSSISSSTCTDLETALKPIHQSIEPSKIQRMLRTILTMNNYITTASTMQLFQAGIFKYIRGLVWLRNMVSCLVNLEYIEIADDALCVEGFCCTSPSICTQSEGQAVCSCTAGLLYFPDLGCQATTTSTLAPTSISTTVIKETTKTTTETVTKETTKDSTMVTSTQGTTMAGSTEDTTMNGSTKETTMGGSTKDTTMGGSTKDTTMDGSTKDTTMGGSTKDTTMGSSTKDTTMGGSTQDTTMDVSTKDTTMGSSTKDTTMGSSTKDTTMGGSTMDTTMNGSTKDTTMGGSTKDTTMGSSTKDTTMSGSTMDTTMGGSTKDTTMGGSTKDTTMGGSTKDTTMSGSTMDTTMGGSTEDTTMAGSTKDTTMDGSTRDSTMGGSTKETTMDGSTMNGPISNTTIDISGSMNTTNPVSGQTPTHMSETSTMMKTTPTGETPILMTHTSTTPKTTTSGQTPVLMSGTSTTPKTTMGGQTPVLMSGTPTTPKTTSAGQTPILMSTTSTPIKTTSSGQTPVLMSGTSTLPKTTPSGQTPVLMSDTSTMVKTTPSGQTPVLMSDTSTIVKTTPSGQTPILMSDTSTTVKTTINGQTPILMHSSSTPKTTPGGQKPVLMTGLSTMTKSTMSGETPVMMTGTTMSS